MDILMTSKMFIC